MSLLFVRYVGVPRLLSYKKVTQNLGNEIRSKGFHLETLDYSSNKNILVLVCYLIIEGPHTFLL